MNDWDTFFVPAVRAFLEGQSPYSVEGFFNPPWLVFLLTPLAWAPPGLAMLFPSLALLLAAHRRRKPWLIPIVGLSFPFLAASVYANIDWLPMLGLAYGGAAGPLLVTVKPQAAGLAVIAFFRRQGARALLPLAAAVALGFILWPGWPADMLAGDILSAEGRNLSLFPYTLPLGIAAVWLAWRRGSLLWGCVASLSLAPYYYIHSLLPLLFILANRKWWLGVLGALGSWGIVALSLAGVISLEF